MKHGWVVGLLLLGCAHSSATSPPVLKAPGEIDALVTALMQRAHVSGVAIAQFAHGQPIYLRAYGWADVDERRPLTVDSVMTAASLTKAAFAYVVLKLVDQGQLDLDRPIGQYLAQPLASLPRYHDLAGDARAERLTARMLLDHTSGLPNLRRFEDDGKLKIHFEPGSRYAYSGEGMQLLQLVVESMAHAPLDSVMQTQLFSPLGMERSSLVWQPRFEGDYANGYDENGARLGPQRRTRPDAAGGLQTTLADYARFFSTVLRGEGLSPKMRAEMLRTQVVIDSAHQFPTLRTETTGANRAIELGYGLGWGVYRGRNGRAFFKEGHDDGWRHYVVGFTDGPAAGSGLLIMTNSGNGESIYQALLERLLGAYDTPMEWEGFTPQVMSTVP